MRPTGPTAKSGRVSGTTNLIMGFCATHAFRRLVPFIASLRRTGFAGDVCLVVQDVPAETITQLRAHAIIVERAGSSAQPNMAAMSSRFFNYQDFLLRSVEHYDNVLLIDPAATVFQADPFGTPLPADIVYTAENCRIGATLTVRDAVVQAYGEAVAHNIRDCTVSNADTTLGTRSGMLRYLAAMAHQLAGRTVPITGAIDRGVHNYVVHMRPLRGAWLDDNERFAVALDTISDQRVEVTGPIVRIADKAPSLLCRWDSDVRVAEHVRASQHFRLDPSMQGSWPFPVVAPRSPEPPAADAVVAFYLRERDKDWLKLCLASLRCVCPSVAVHCIGDFNNDDIAILQQYNCIGYAMPATDPVIAENVAHFYLNRILERMEADTAQQPDQVLLIDNMRAIFPRDPFQAKTIGLSLFCEGPLHIGDSEYNHSRLAFFVTPDQPLLRNPIVSSMLLRGRLSVVREFYRRMFAELVGQTELLKIHKVVQGVVNKLARSDEFDFPIIVHPNGAEVHFDHLGSNLAVDTRYGVRVGGTVPGVVLAGHLDAPIVLKLRIDLNLSD